jgi:tetratricopeptide (TPR) repeat protein
MRNIGIFAVATVPILARHLTFASEAAGKMLRRQAPTLSQWLPRPSRVAVLVVAVVWATATLLSPAWSVLHQDQSRHYRFGAGLARYSAPAAAVEFIEEHGLEGPLYNSWALGGYVIWRSWPRLQVSLDGRQMLYEHFLGELERVGLEPMLRRLGVRMGLAEFHDRQLIRAFRATGEFRLVFFDDVAMVFLRSDAVGDSILPYELLRPEDLSMSWLPRRDEATLATALQEAERATRETPDSSRAWMILGSLARRAADLSRSVEALQRAIALDPTQKSYHNNLGIALLESGRAAEALDALDTAVRLDPWAFEAHYNSGLALVEMGSERAALRSFRRALRRDPDRAEAHVMLGALEPDRARARKHLLRGIELARQPDLAQRARSLLAELDGSAATGG